MDIVSSMETKLKKTAVLAIFLPVFFLVRWAYDRYTSHINVPAVGVPPGILGRLKAPYRWRKGSQHLIDEGMAKYGVLGKPFKIATPARWMVFITNPTVLNELKYISPTIMSFRKASDEAVNSEHTFHEGLMTGAWHLEMIRKNITEKITKDLSQILSEVLAAWGDSTNVGDEWTEIYPWAVMLKVISRATNRVLVGLPLCRNDEFLESVINFTLNVVATGNKLDLIPSVFHAFTVKHLLPHEKFLTTVMKYVGPVFDERRQQMKDQKWDARNAPNDAIQWILEAYPPESPTRILTLGLLFLEFVSIHTSSITIVQVLFDLAANPTYQAPLRDEIEAQLRDDRGWTVQALADMKKVDSVLRESARLNGTNIFTILRQVITSHTFSDGTHVTKGAWVAAPAVSIHRWDKFYKNPDVFDGFRFYEMRKAEGNATKFQNVTTSLEFLPFGDGPYSCPGRFFATNELKVILAFLISNYEFKLETGVKRPANLFEGIASFPDTRVGMLVRKRKNIKNSQFFSDRA